MLGEIRPEMFGIDNNTQMKLKKNLEHKVGMMTLMIGKLLYYFRSLAAHTAEIVL
jgi:hypothetical protein